MNTDFRISTTFTSNPNTRLLRRQYGTDAAWALIELWAWAAVNKASGIFTGMNEDQIEAAADWNGKQGELIKALVAFEWLTKTQDGVYALNEWAETNPWAADADNRSDKARLSSMAKNYPELYEELTAQGFSGIDKVTYASLTAEYNQRGILRSTSDFQRIASESLAPTPAPVPAPFPAPEPFPKEEDVVRRTTSSASEKNKGKKSSNRAEKISSQSKTSDKAEINPAQTLIPFEDTKTPEPQCTEHSTKAEETGPFDTTAATEEEATLMNILMEWNIILGVLGFPKVNKATHRRRITFQARLKASQERSSLAWWIALFGKIAASDFMRESAAQKANWLTIDWVLNEHNMMKILEGKYDSERPVIADIHRGYGRFAHSQNTSQSSSQGETATETSDGIPETPKEKIPGIPEESRRRLSEYYRIMHGTNEGNPYEVPDVPHDNVEVPTIEAEFSETGCCHDNEVNTDTQEAAQENVCEGKMGTEETPIGEMSMEEYEAFVKEQKQAIEEFERYRKENGLFYVQ